MEELEEMKRRNKEIERTYRTNRWGIRFMYIVAFALYTYFMYFDKLFENSREPFIIASLAYLLLVPLMILPVDAILRFRIRLFAVKQSFSTNYISKGSQMAVTPDGKLLSFIGESTWRIKGTGDVFEKGVIQSVPSPKEALKLHQEMQEHLSWSRVVLAESKSLNILCGVLNILILCLPTVHTELVGETGTSLGYLIFMTTIWLMLLSQLQGLLMYLVFLRKKTIVSFADVNDESKTFYAISNRNKTDSIILSTINEGFKVKHTAVTLNGGLLLTVYRNNSIVEHLVIDGRK